MASWLENMLDTSPRCLDSDTPGLSVHFFSLKVLSRRGHSNKLLIQRHPRSRLTLVLDEDLHRERRETCLRETLWVDRSSTSAAHCCCHCYSKNLCLDHCRRKKRREWGKKRLNKTSFRQKNTMYKRRSVKSLSKKVKF